MTKGPRATKVDFNFFCKHCAGIRIWIASGKCHKCTPRPSHKKMLAAARAKKESDRRKLAEQRIEEREVMQAEREAKRRASIQTATIKNALKLLPLERPPGHKANERDIMAGARFEDVERAWV